MERLSSNLRTTEVEVGRWRVRASLCCVVTLKTPKAVGHSQNPHQVTTILEFQISDPRGIPGDSIPSYGHYRHPHTCGM